MSGKKIVVVGATGLIGGLALRYVLEDPDVGSVTSVGRRPLGIQDPKLREVVHSDFSDCSPIREELAGHDVALFCLGVYTGAVPDDELRKITVDYAVAFAEALLEGSPHAAFCLLSGEGADQAEKSRMAFANYKGAAEKALVAMGFSRVHLFRPGYIYPVTPREKPIFWDRIMRPLYPLAERIYPNIGVSSEDLAMAMVRAGLEGTPGFEDPVLRNKDIRALAAAWG
jgi:uncharacterized protein YbjT (DUF2867 family)